MDIPNNVDISTNFPLSFQLPYLLLNQKSWRAQIVGAGHAKGVDYEQYAYNHNTASRASWGQKSIHLGAHFFSPKASACIDNFLVTHIAINEEIWSGWSITSIPRSLHKPKPCSASIGQSIMNVLVTIIMICSLLDCSRVKAESSSASSRRPSGVKRPGM